MGYSKEKYIGFTSEDNIGSGFLVKLKNNDVDMVLTAKHCISNDNIGKLEFLDLNYSIVRIFKSKRLDIACIIIKKTSCEDEYKYYDGEFKLEENYKYSLYGYPALKRENDMKDEKFNLKYIDCIDKNLKFKVKRINEDETVSTPKKELLEGVSGAPVTVLNNNDEFLVGMFNKSESYDLKYNEINVISIKEIFDELREENLIYFRNGNINDGIVYRSSDIEGDNKLSALLIGKSGSGKSAFINSFLKHADLLDGSGEGQTTRTNVEYNIFNKLEKDKRYIQIKFLSKKEFVELRMNQIEDKLKVYMDEDKVMEFSELFHLITDIKGFFNYKEFDFYDEVSSEIKDNFKIWFNGNIKNEYTFQEYKELKSKNELSGEELKEEFYSLRDIIELFYEMIYILIDKKIKINSLNKKIMLNDEMSSEEKKYIQYSLKSVSEGDKKTLSYSGLISKIIINDSICDEYIDLFERLNIKSLKLIDTYGLDHIDELTKEALFKRLPKIFDDYQEIETVFYIRKLNTDSPTDIETTMTALYTVNPRVTLYAIFSEIDKNDKVLDEYKNNHIINLREMNKKNKIKAIEYFIENEEEDEYFRIKHPIKVKMIEDGVSEQLASSIYDVLIDKLTPYCAAPKRIERYRFIENNTFHLEKLLRSIINKEYLGDEIIEFERIKKNINKANIKIEEMIKKIFMIATIDNWYNHGNWKTHEANISRIKKGELGYWGTYRDTWNSRFSKGYDDVFSKLSDEDFIELINVDPKMKQAAPIRKLLNSFSKSFIGCEKYNFYQFINNNNDNRCYNCKFSKQCFREILMKSYREGEFETYVSNRDKWLNEICNFYSRLDSILDELKDIFIEKFLMFFEEECKVHNNRIIVDKINKNCSKEIEIIRNLIEKYNPECSKIQISEIISSCINSKGK